MMSHTKLSIDENEGNYVQFPRASKQTERYLSVRLWFPFKFLQSIHIYNLHLLLNIYVHNPNVVR